MERRGPPVEHVRTMKHNVEENNKECTAEDWRHWSWRLTIHLARQSLQKPFFHSPQAGNAYEKKGERAIFQRGKERNRSRKIGKIGWKIGKDW